MFGRSRGFVLTTDAVLAAIIVGTLLSAIFITLDRALTVPERDRPLKEMCADIMTTAEKHGSLERAWRTGNDEELRQILNGVPATVCLRINVYTYDSLKFTTSNIGCTCDEDLAVFKRTFVSKSGNQMSINRAEVRGCYRS